MGVGMAVSHIDSASEPDFDIVFSSRDGFVWVSWPNSEVVLRLGPDEQVVDMMHDFLAQDALGKRLSTHL
jgi:hypothetical protein